MNQAIVFIRLLAGHCGDTYAVAGADTIARCQSAQIGDNYVNSGFWHQFLLPYEQESEQVLMQCGLATTDYRMSLPTDYRMSMPTDYRMTQ